MTTGSSFWDERYGGDGFAYGTAPNRWLEAQVAALPAGGRVLCLGEGEGRNAVWLAEQGFTVDAVDGSPVGLDALKPAGIVIIEAFAPRQLGRPSGGPRQAEMLYDASLLRADFPGVECDLLPNPRRLNARVG